MHTQCDYTLLTQAPEEWPLEWAMATQDCGGSLWGTNPEASWSLSLTGLWQGCPQDSVFIESLFFLLLLLLYVSTDSGWTRCGSCVFFLFDAYSLFFSSFQTGKLFFVYWTTITTTKKEIPRFTTDWKGYCLYTWAWQSSEVKFDLYACMFSTSLE